MLSVLPHLLARRRRQAGVPLRLPHLPLSVLPRLRLPHLLLSVLPRLSLPLHLPLSVLPRLSPPLHLDRNLFLLRVRLNLGQTKMVLRISPVL